MVPAALVTLSRSSQVGPGTQASVKSLPWTSGPLSGTGVTPSCANTWALSSSGGISHIPPVAPSGRRSRIVTFQASPSPTLWTSSVKVPHSVTFSVAGPVLVMVSTGATMVIGSLMPHSPGSGS